jgi:G3E family GTPase
VRGDLIRIIEGLLKRRGKFDAILVETTGLADPAPVAQTFFVDADVREAARLDAVVTIADAKWLTERLRDAPEAKNQIAFADVIILNKTDLVDADALREIEAHIRAINPYAKLHKTVNCAVPLDAVLGRNAFDLQRILEIEPEFLEAEDDHDHEHEHHNHEHHDHEHHEPHGLTHYHDEDIQSVGLSIEGDVDPEKFMPWLQDYVQREGVSILRAKGILAFKDEPKRFVFQGVHMLLDGDLQREWKPQEKRVSRLVFIGRNLKEDEITRGFMSCAA